jgi:hypothetical protein
MILKAVIFSCAALVGCTNEKPPVDFLSFVDCGNGYMVRPPLACPEIGAKF